MFNAPKTDVPLSKKSFETFGKKCVFLLKFFLKLCSKCTRNRHTAHCWRGLKIKKVISTNLLYRGEEIVLLTRVERQFRILLQYFQYFAKLLHPPLVRARTHGGVAPLYHTVLFFIVLIVLLSFYQVSSVFLAIESFRHN